MTAALPPIVDKKVLPGSALAAGGTATFDIAIPTDRLVYLRAIVNACDLSAGHLNAVGGVQAECWVANRNGTLGLGSAITGSANPFASGSARTNRSEVSDTDFNNTDVAFLTANWSLSTTNGRLTVTNNGTTGAMAYLVGIIEIFIFGAA